MNTDLMKSILQVGVTLLCAAAVSNAEETIEATGVAGGGRTIRIPGTETVLVLWDEHLPDGQVRSHCGISRDGRTFDRIAPVSYQLGFRYARFDPLVSQPQIDPRLAADEGGRLFIVQFHSQPLALYREQISALGGKVHHYLAQFAFLVEIDRINLAALEALPYVRWIGPYHPAYRLEEYLLDNLGDAAEILPRLRYNIQVMEVAQKRIVANRIQDMGGSVDQPNAGKVYISATLTPLQLLEVIRWNEVLFVDRWGPYEADMDIAREISGANHIETVAGYTGQGVRGEVIDGGPNLDHVDLQNPPPLMHGYTWFPDWHASATVGINFGDGTGNPIARGMLPDAQGIVADIDYVPLTGEGRYAHNAELIEDPYYAVYQSASVGGLPLTGEYTIVSADTDHMIFDFDTPISQSLGNYGTQIGRAEGWAKNIVSCGGIIHMGTLDRADDHWGPSGASIGPAADGRIKPTLVHFYDQVFTVSCCDSMSYEPAFYGTSCAAAIIGGHLGLAFQMWSEGVFGNEVDPGATVFENRCHCATMKALLINTAYQYPFSGPEHDLTRMHQGWGMPSLLNLYEMRDQIYVIDETDLLEPFEVDVHEVCVAEGEPAFKVTMVYTDRPGVPSVQTQHRINDLTLRVISPSNTIYYGNHGLDEHVWSIPGGVPDTKNTVECVYVENPEPGIWTMEIRGDEIILDSHIETPEIDCDYALVASGVDPLSGAAVDGQEVVETGADLVIHGANPRSGDVRVSFTLPKAAAVRLCAHDLQGRLVATLHDGPATAGVHTIVWAGRDSQGTMARPGVYFLRLEAGEDVVSRKMLLIH